MISRLVSNAMVRDLPWKRSRSCQGLCSKCKLSKLKLTRRCPYCHGEGRVITKHCHVCDGTKVSKGLDSLIVVIEKGLDNGHVYTYTEAGDEYLNDDPSDINVKINIAEHDKFERINNNLKTKIDLTLKEVSFITSGVDRVRY